MAGTVSRRNFLKVGALLGTAHFWLNPIYALAQSGERGGVLTCNLQSDPPSLDPLANSSSRTIYAIAPCYNSLVMFDPANPSEIIGDLAESWDVSEDGKRLTFHIVKNATFHDGVPLTAADVKFTFDRVRNPPEGVVSVREQSLVAVNEINALDDYTVEFVLSAPSPSFLTILAAGWMVVIPKHFVEGGGDLSKTVLGSGPFKFQNYQAGTSIELVRNEKYHKPDMPYLDGITFYIVPDPGTVGGYFRTGQILVWENLTGSDGRKAQADMGDAMVLQATPSLGYSAIYCNTNKAPFDDIRVRQAVNLALDRREALRILRQNDGYLGGLMPAQGKWSMPEDEVLALPGFGTDREADLAKAKALLKEAGVENASIKLLTRRNVAYEALAVLLTDQLGKVGLNCTIDIQEDATAYDMLNKGDFQVAAWEGNVGGDDPDSVFGEQYLCDAGRNFAGSCNAQLDALFAEQTKELDEERRRQLVREMEHVALADYGQILLYWRMNFLAQSSKVQGLVRHPQMDNNRRFETVWLSNS